MSWFKKIFGLQYGFNSQISLQGSSQDSSEEPKVHHTKQKNETDGIHAETENLTISEIEDTTQSAQDSCYSWSGVSQEIDIKREERELSDEEEGPWWEPFKSQSTQKLTHETQMQKFHSLQASSQASSQAQACSLQDDNKSDNKEEKKDDKKNSFYLKLGKYKKKNICNFSFRIYKKWNM